MWSAKHDGSDREPVTESDKIVSAFGRNGGSAVSREAAKAIVETAQNKKHWFICGCRKGAVLAPVNGTHVRRKTPNSTPHRDDCPFAVEPAEQVFVVKSLRPHSADTPFSLLRERTPSLAEGVSGTVRESHSTRRRGLAKLLVSLAEASTIQRQGRTILALGEQFGSLRAQARNFWLARNVRVSTMLCSDTRRYDDFIRDFDQKSREAQFPDNIRPHGILLDTIKGVSEGSLICNDNSLKPVLGSISIFGRDDAPVKPWSTYIVAGLIGRLSTSPEPCLLRAYVHPCVSSRNLMLVDSNYERGTLEIIHKLQVEYGDVININARKPLTDVGLQQINDNISDDDAIVDAERHGAPKVLVPDFILEFPQFTEGKADIIVETLGFSWPSYRFDKAVTIPAMRAALGGIASIAHDFHFPKNENQAQRNDRFEKQLRTMIEERVKRLRG